MGLHDSAGPTRCRLPEVVRIVQLEVETNGTGQGHIHSHAGLGPHLDAALHSRAIPIDEADQLRIEVVKGKVAPGPDAQYQVDGLAGATLTSVGVSNLLQFWLGERGFGPYLANVRRGAL